MRDRYRGCPHAAEFATIGFQNEPKERCHSAKAWFPLTGTETGEAQVCSTPELTAAVGEI